MAQSFELCAFFFTFAHDYKCISDTMGIYQRVRQLLTAAEIEGGEAQAIAFMLLEDVRGLSRAEALMCEDEDDELLLMAQRIADGEPVQYVTGKTWFCGNPLHVGPGVLIPRPETEELVSLVASSCADGTEGAALRIVDIGTGSGCIAVSLAKLLEHAAVEAWDVSEEALAIAESNARLNEVSVAFRKVDILSDADVKALDIHEAIDVIVSNPPYICHREAAEMESHVLDHEPHLALFVPDDDPLLFYRRIATIGKEMLRSGGVLCYEINRLYGPDTVAMLTSLGYRDVQLLRDQFDNDRMVKAIKP